MPAGVAVPIEMTRSCLGSALTRFAALSTLSRGAGEGPEPRLKLLSRTAGEGGPSPLPNPPPLAGEGMGGGLVGEGNFA